MELLCFLTINILPINNPILLFINKLYLMYFIIFLFLFYIYILVISTPEEKIREKIKKYYLYMCIVAMLSFVLILYLPIYLQVGDMKYSYGPAVNYIFLYSAFFVTLSVFMMIKNFKKIKNTKYLSLVIYALGSGSVGIIQKMRPDLTLSTTINSIVLFIMYFTIENPDMKILEEVHKAKEISDSANEEKAMFLYNMTNDIRNITKEIESSTDNILSETDNKSINIEYINDNAREIKSSTAKFTTMTNEILDVSSIDSSNIKIYNDRYNIKLILRQLVQEYKKKAEDKNIEFRTDIVSTLPEYLYGDSVGVKKVLSTIFENSLKYTESGYIEFSVNTITKQDIARLIITIEDSGRGIKAEDIDKIFNKKEEDKDYTNLNNNLYNARKLITLMGGTIIPSSVYGKGTVIKLVLDQKIYEEDTTEKKYDKYLDKKKVLVVDDSEASIKLISKILDNSNIEIEGVSLGKECLDRIRNKEKYDLILIDEKMEPISGLELMSKLKDIKNFNIKTILMTRNNDYEYNEEYIKYGFDDYILKPLDKDKVLEKLSKYL